MTRKKIPKHQGKSFVDFDILFPDNYQNTVLREYRINPKTLIVLNVTLSIILAIGVTLLTGGEFYKIIIRMGLIVFINGILWKLVETYLWKLDIFRRTLFNNIPDLNGRWEGVINREGEDNPHALILEIHQILTYIQVDAYSRQGGGPSFTARLCIDQSGKQFWIIYTWWCKTDGIIGDAKSGYFQGTSVLRFIPGEPQKLVGEYFTDRSPAQTKGKATFIWKDRQLKYDFK